MDKELLQFLYIVLTAIGTLSVGFLAVDFKVCHDFTGTWNGFRFLLNMRYWAMSILYKRYQEAKTEGMSTSKFIIAFTERYLLDVSNSKWRFMPDTAKITFVEILSSPKFIDQYLDIDQYSYKYHKEVMAAWERLKQQKAKERSQCKDIFNF